MDLGPNVWLSLLLQKKGGKTLTVDYNFQYGSGKIAKTVMYLMNFRALIADKRPGMKN
jgi:iron complex outermembrane receptor protein